MSTKNKISLITDVTGQDGAYLDGFLQERVKPSTVASGASRFSTPIELTRSTRIHVSLRTPFQTIACPPTSTAPTQRRFAAQPRRSGNDPQTPRGKVGRRTQPASHGRRRTNSRRDPRRPEAPPLRSMNARPDTFRAPEYPNAECHGRSLACPCARLGGGVGRIAPGRTRGHVGVEGFSSG